jgi:hypothetical protein
MDPAPQFNVGFTGTAPFTYTYFNGTSNVGPIVTSNNPEIITVSPNLTTSYNVVTVSDANCVGSAAGVATVTVNQIPDAVLTGDAEICYGDVTNLNIVFTGVHHLLTPIQMERIMLALSPHQQIH